MSPTSPHHPYASVLRQRAAHLRHLAAGIDRSLVTALPEAAELAGWTGPRAELCVDLLARNLHQLHRAADELRERAFRLRQRADELDRTHRAIA